MRSRSQPTQKVGRLTSSIHHSCTIPRRSAERLRASLTENTQKNERSSGHHGLRSVLDHLRRSKPCPTAVKNAEPSIFGRALASSKTEIPHSENSIAVLNRMADAPGSNWIMGVECASHPDITAIPSRYIAIPAASKMRLVANNARFEGGAIGRYG